MAAVQNTPGSYPPSISGEDENKSRVSKAARRFPVKPQRVRKPVEAPLSLPGATLTVQPPSDSDHSDDESNSDASSIGASERAVTEISSTYGLSARHSEDHTRFDQDEDLHHDFDEFFEARESQVVTPDVVPTQANADVIPVPERPVLPPVRKPKARPALIFPYINGEVSRAPVRRPESPSTDEDDSDHILETRVEEAPTITTETREQARAEAYVGSTTRLEVAPRPISTPEDIQKGKRLWTVSKFTFMTCQVSINFLFIFSTWWWSRYYYIYLPFITITVALNCCMVVSIILHRLFRLAKPEEKLQPSSPESLVYILPCYNETVEEMTRSMDSLVEQEGIDQHQRAVLIVVDGRVRSKRMEKTAADHMLDDILTERTSRKEIRNAYNAWDTHPMDITMQTGSYRGLPYFCIVKHRNQGKRDSLIVARSFLYKFNMRSSPQTSIFSRKLFGELTRFLQEDAGMAEAELLVGMDADTVFAPDCVANLIPESRYKNTGGVCGYVCVDFTQHGNWSIWSLYQNAEYTISQALRRMHQSIATHKVSCLPGCCQLLRVCEETCGDEVLINLFGYYPYPTDQMLKQIRATASEDRNHVCLMLSARSKIQTRQALRARAFTDVPHSWPVFLSQRRRWTLGATSNDLYLITASGINIFERVLALANVVTWFLNPFILASIASFIVACTIAPYWVILAFASVMIVPMIYYVCIAIWLPRTARSRMQYLLGLLCYVFLGPFLNIAVLLYAIWNMDNFGWGKTRKIVKEPEMSEKTRRRQSLIAAANPTAREWDEEARVGTPAPGVHRTHSY